MRINRYELGFLAGVCLLALLAVNCGMDEREIPEHCISGSEVRTEGCDEFLVLDARVYRNAVEQIDVGWQPLVAGDQLFVDENGQAELNVAQCWDGQLYLFHSSSGVLGVPYCVQADWESANAICLHSGELMAAGCGDAFRAATGSAVVGSQGTVYSITSLPDQRDTTLVVVLTGTVTITPVNELVGMKMGDSATLNAGEFYFTMPVDRLATVADLRPREVYPVAELAPLSEELLIQEWMKNVGEMGQQRKVLPPAWPTKLRGLKPQGSWSVVLDGGQLAEPTVQEAIIRAVDWERVRAELGVPDAWVTVEIGDREAVDVRTLPHDPDLAKELLSEAGFSWDEPVLILYPSEEELLAKAAEWISSYLAEISIEARPEGVEGKNLDFQWKLAVGSGAQVIRLVP